MWPYFAAAAFLAVIVLLLIGSIRAMIHARKTEAAPVIHHALGFMCIASYLFGRINASWWEVMIFQELAAGDQGPFSHHQLAGGLYVVRYASLMWNSLALLSLILYGMVLLIHIRIKRRPQAPAQATRGPVK